MLHSLILGLRGRHHPRTLLPLRHDRLSFPGEGLSLGLYTAAVLLVRLLLYPALCLLLLGILSALLLLALDHAHNYILVKLAGFCTVVGLLLLDGGEALHLCNKALALQHFLLLGHLELLFLAGDLPLALLDHLAHQVVPRSLLPSPL